MQASIKGDASLEWVVRDEAQNALPIAGVTRSCRSDRPRSESVIPPPPSFQLDQLDASGQISCMGIRLCKDLRRRSQVLNFLRGCIERHRSGQDSYNSNHLLHIYSLENGRTDFQRASCPHVDSRAGKFVPPRLRSYLACNATKFEWWLANAFRRSIRTPAAPPSDPR